MKVIELLNNICKGIEVPKKIRWYATEYIFNNKNGRYETKEGNLLKISTDIDDLFFEVEIIEEDKKIRNLKSYYDSELEEHIFYEDGDKPNNCIVGSAGEQLLIDKINEIIDKVNKLGEDK